MQEAYPPQVCLDFGCSKENLFYSDSYWNVGAISGVEDEGRRL